MLPTGFNSPASLNTHLHPLSSVYPRPVPSHASSSPGNCVPTIMNMLCHFQNMPCCQNSVLGHAASSRLMCFPLYLTVSPSTIYGNKQTITTTKTLQNKFDWPRSAGHQDNELGRQWAVYKHLIGEGIIWHVGRTHPMRKAGSLRHVKKREQLVFSSISLPTLCNELVYNFWGPSFHNWFILKLKIQ